MTKRQDAIEAVIERDRVCFDCGNGESLELHHVVARSKFGRNAKAKCWQERNMIRLCPQCHRLKDKQAGSHTHAARVRHLGTLKELYGYDYSDKPWAEFVE